MLRLVLQASRHRPVCSLSVLRKPHQASSAASYLTGPRRKDVPTPAQQVPFGLAAGNSHAARPVQLGVRRNMASLASSDVTFL